MMPVPADLPSRDVMQWLQNGWFFVERGTNRVPTVCQMVDFRDDGNRLRVSTPDGDSFNIARSRVFAHWPVCGAVNLDGYAVVINRASVQQYRRTYNSRCLSISVPRKWDVMKAKGTEASVHADSPSVVVAAFNPVYFTYAEAMQKLDDGWVSVAMNPHLLLAGDGDTMLVYYRGEMVGKITNSRLVPIGTDELRLRRLLKFFDGRVTL